MAINNTSIYEECLKAMARQKIALDVSKYPSLFFYKIRFGLLCGMDFLLAIALFYRPGDIVLCIFFKLIFYLNIYPNSKYQSLFFYKIRFGLLCGMDFLLAIALFYRPGDIVLCIFFKLIFYLNIYPNSFKPYVLNALGFIIPRYSLGTWSSKFSGRFFCFFFMSSFHEKTKLL